MIKRPLPGHAVLVLAVAMSPVMWPALLLEYIRNQRFLARPQETHA